MNLKLDKKLARFRRASISTFLFTLLPALFWWGAVSIRPILIQPRCATHTQSCSKESVLAIDRLSLGMEDWKADEYSFFTQNLSGTLAFVVPTLWTLSLYAFGHLTPLMAFTTLGVDVVTVLQTIAWNGFLTETSHLVSQRPRPFVYQDPLLRGTDPAHYTSFYSGHTSAAAATCLATLLILISRGAPLPLVLTFAALGESLILSTAYFRILAGRHFLTDVLVGAVAGLLVAWIVFSTRKSRSPGLNIA